MTAHEPYLAPTDGGLDSPLTTASRNAHAEPALGVRDMSKGAWNDSVPRERSLPGHDGGRVGVDEGVADGNTLITAERSADYRARWKAVQGDFIDEPRKAVTDADSMVGEVLDQLAQTFHQQRRSLEEDWADDKSTTEELRIALRRYRTFFDRLLTL